MYRYHHDNIGEFYEVECGNNFTYKETKDAWALEQGLKHEIDLLDYGVAFANIKKTVAYVCVNEAADGSAVMEKWSIKKHNTYLSNRTYD